MRSLVSSGRILPGILLAAVLLVALACIAGCTQQTTQPPVPTTAPAGMPNPASVACGQAGGTTEIRKDPAGGEYGMCTFANGTSCEEWALFRGEGCRPGTTVAVTTPPDGKKLVTFTEADNGKTSVIARGTKFAVQLKENPTTGFQWNATLSSGLDLVSDDFQTDPHAEGMVGVGGTRTWVILAGDGGSQKFSAVYRRSWEPVTGNETAFGMNINVE